MDTFTLMLILHTWVYKDGHQAGWTKYLSTENSKTAHKYGHWVGC